MKRIFLLCMLCALSAASARAQFTLVSGTVTDPNGLAWACGTISATLINTNGVSATLNGVSFSGFTAPVKLGCPTDATTSRTAGFFQMQLADNTVIKCGIATCGTQTTWQFTVNTTGIAPPQGTGPQSFSQTFTVSGSTQTLTFTGVPALSLSSSSASSPGPVINVTNPTYSGCPSTSGDWTACFTSVTAAATAAAQVSVGVPTIRSVVSAPQTAGTKTTVTATISMSAGDTGLVGIMATATPLSTFSVSDTVNSYSLTNLYFQVPGGYQVSIFATGVGAGKAISNGTLTVTCLTSCPILFGFVYLDAFNVGSIGYNKNINNTATSVTPSNTSTLTRDNNNIIASFFEFQCAGAADTVSANVGTLQASWNSSATVCGGGLITNTSATPAAVTTSATLSVSQPWAMTSIELRSVQVSVPTVYLPSLSPPQQSLSYNYQDVAGASPLNFTLPVTLKGEGMGGPLCYSGTHHVIDLGSSSLTTGTQPDNYFKILNIKFDCAGSATEGIFLNNLVLYTEIANNQFINSGNTNGSFAWVWAAGNNDDVYVHDNNYFMNDGAFTVSTPGTNGLVRQWVNMSNGAGTSTLRFINNSAGCLSGNGTVGCNSTIGTTPPLLTLLGITHLILGNNFFGGFCPIVQLLNGDNNTKIEMNHVEIDNSNCPAITFQTGVVGLRVTNNYMIGGGSAMIAPVGGSDTLVNANISDNYILRLPAATPVVTLNNLTGQVNNFAWHNMCGTGTTTAAAPCPLTHTAGGNISQWNADYAPKLTFAAGTTASYTFGTTYASAPFCTIPPNIPGTATTLTITTLNTTTLTITASASNSATVNALCSPEQ